MTARARWLLVAALALSASTVGARGAAAQSASPARFYITEVGDSTFTFHVDGEKWVRPGQRGRAVDPARRDTLVAMFRILRVTGGDAVALVTGQTTQLTDRHVVLLDMPRKPWYRRALFWVGVLVGGGLGAAAGSAL